MRVLMLVLALILTSAVPAWAADPLPTTERISLATDGTQGDPGNGGSVDAAISADGRYVVYWSEATTLVTGDTNDNWDVFATDRWTRRTTRVSVRSGGTQSSGDNSEATAPPAVDANARYVAFASAADDLVPGDTNGVMDILVHDRWNRTTARVSVTSSGAQANGGSRAPAISADGRYVTFVSMATNLVPGVDGGVFRHDRTTRRTTLVAANTPTAISADIWAAISADGRFIAVTSDSSSLVPGDTNGVADTFVRDTVAGTTTRVSVASTGAQGNQGSLGVAALSENGRYVVFTSFASNLAPGDTNGILDVFFHDRWSRATTQISPSTPGPHGTETQLTFYPAISANGRWVAYTSAVRDFPFGDQHGLSDVFFHDRWAGTTRRISVPDAGGDADNGAVRPSLSADARFVSYYSPAENLVPGDTNQVSDIFVWRRF